MSDSQRWLIRGARPAGGEPADLLICRRPHRRDRSRPRARRARRSWTAAGLIALPGLVDLHTHLREPGREDAETVRERHRGGGARRLHRRARDGQHRPGRRHGRRGRADLAARPAGGPLRRAAGRRGHRPGWPAASWPSWARWRTPPPGSGSSPTTGAAFPTPALMRRALEYVKAFGGVIAQHAQEPRLTDGAQMNEGEFSGRLGLTGWPAVAEEAVIARDCLLAAHVGSAAACLPRVHGRLGGAHPVGEVQGLAGHGRGHAASPAADRRAGCQLRPGLQGEPAAAHRGRRGGAARRARRRHHRLRGHRSCPAPC